MSNIKLSDYLGKWVVLFYYPGDFTFACATEISAVGEKSSVFQGMGVIVLSMSIDSMFVHKMWDDDEPAKMVAGGVPCPMLSDLAGIRAKNHCNQAVIWLARSGRNGKPIWPLIDWMRCARRTGRAKTAAGEIFERSLPPGVSLQRYQSCQRSATVYGEPGVWKKAPSTKR